MDNIYAKKENVEQLKKELTLKQVLKNLILKELNLSDDQTNILMAKLAN